MRISALVSIMPRLPPRSWFYAFAIVALAMVVPRVWPHNTDVYWREERYALVAKGAASQMSLAFTDDVPSAKIEDVIVRPTVFEIGADERFIVLKQHPALDSKGTKYDRTVTNYFIVKRTQSSSEVDRQQGLFGPMQQHEFTELAKEWRLPAFTTRFDQLN